MSNDAINPIMNPWHPMTDKVDLKTMGKFVEELGECTAAASRCLIQGINESEPITGKPNRAWLEDEIADVMAGIVLVGTRFGLDLDKMTARAEKKEGQLRSWHEMA